MAMAASDPFIILHSRVRKLALSEDTGRGREPAADTLNHSHESSRPQIRSQAQRREPQSCSYVQCPALDHSISNAFEASVGSILQ